MGLSAQEQQLFDMLVQKQTPQPPPQQAAPPTTIDMHALSNLIDAKVAERISQMNPMAPALTQVAHANQQAQPQQAQQPMAKPDPRIIVNQEKVIMEKLRPLFMKALTFEQKGRFAELAINVRLNSHSTETAYRVGIDALCDFLATRAGKEWIQVGASAFLECVATAGESADVPARVNVQQPKE